MTDFEAVQHGGHHQRARRRPRLTGMRRVVALSTATFFDLSTAAPFEEAPVLDNPPDDPYTVTKLAAFREAHARAAAGEDVLTCHPGRDLRARPRRRAGAAPNQLQPSTTGRHARPAQALSRVPGDLGGGGRCRAWVDRGARPRCGRRTLSADRTDPRTPSAPPPVCNRACELAGIDHRVEDLDYRSDPEALTLEFGPTLMAIAEAAAREVRAPRTADNPTSRRLGYDPMSLDEGLGLLIPWLRKLGSIVMTTGSC